LSTDQDSQPEATVGEVERLLNLSTRAARNGNRAVARRLLYAITREYPQEARAWLWLAGVAENPAEQQQALERVLELDPEHPLARQRLQQLQSHADTATPMGFTPPGNVAVPQPAAPAPHLPPDRHSRTDRKQQSDNSLVFLIAVAVLLAAIIGTLVYQGLNSNPGNVAVPPTPPLALREETPQPAPTQAAVLPANPDSPAESTVLPPPPTVAVTTGTGGVEVPAGPPAPTMSEPVGTVSPVIEAVGDLPMGALREYDAWQATLLRPDFAVVLDGAIGDLQPQGRFVLALVAISNNSDQPRRIPPDMFTLIDAQGRRYQPVPNASARYLDMFGRGQRGDLAFEDEIRPDSGLVSVPLVFDVPPDADDLRLAMGDVAGGVWPVVGSDEPGGIPPTPAPDAAP
jgi:hypothetical protein